MHAELVGATCQQMFAPKIPIKFAKLIKNYQKVCFCDKL